MSHHAEARIVGRHRQAASPRHRASRGSSGRPVGDPPVSARPSSDPSDHDQLTGAPPFGGQPVTDRPVGGRHRQRAAPGTILVGTPRGRTALATATTLGAALVTGVGVAGGSATAAVQHTATIRHTGSILAPSPAAAASSPTATPDPAHRGNGSPSTYVGSPTAADIDSPVDRTGRIPVGHPSAVPVRHKLRPRPTIPAVRAGHDPAPAAWVNPNPTAVVTSCFGPRWGRLHAGVDLAAPEGTPIVAAGAGVVVRAGTAEGYGIAVLIDHGNGYLTHYGHLSALTVTVGQRVRAGQQIGNEGETGHATGPHLHFEVHQGHYKNPVEPTEWLREHGVDIPGCAPATAAPSARAGAPAT